jgi:predicted nuclease of predicted toxin-antitoxin system
MRILLDENLDWRLRRELPAHEVESVVQLGWAGIENGALLKKAVEARFELLVTMDGRMAHQQNIAGHAIAIIANSNRLADTRPLMPQLLALFPRLKPGTVTFVQRAGG